MISYVTQIDQIELRMNGDVRVRLIIAVLNDQALLSSEWHRLTVPMGASAQAECDAVNDGLRLSNKPLLGQDSIDLILQAVSEHQGKFTIIPVEAPVEEAPSEETGHESE